MKRTMRPAPPLSIAKHLHGWHVTSTSRLEVTYFITNVPHWRCTCGAFLYSKGGLPCKHIRAVKEVVANGAKILRSGLRHP